MTMSVVIAGGGTGGHILPALALADALRRADPEIAITCLGTERGMETRLVPQRGYDLALIPPVPLPRSLTPELASVPGRMLSSVNAAAEILDEVAADVLVGFGGYVATPGYLAARRRGVPIVVHEANCKPGLANRIGARLTQQVFTGQPGVKLAHARYIGIPIRREISGLDRLALGDPGPAPLRPRPAPPPGPAPPCRCCWSPAGRRAPGRSTGRSWTRPGRCARRASRCCTSSGRARRRSGYR